ncbi:hypothetical protein V6N13_133276 [Hibiscus sabdariffa]
MVKLPELQVLPGVQLNWGSLITQTPELPEQSLQTNYYGTKRTCELLLHLLQRSDSPRIVNVSASIGKLKGKNLTNSRYYSFEPSPADHY